LRSGVLMSNAGKSLFAAQCSRPPMKKRLTERGVKRMREREASIGLDPDDSAARWLAEHDAPPPPKTPKSAKKSVALHRFKQRQGH
jgi:hypothetical protein